MRMNLARTLCLALVASVMLAGCQHLSFVHIYDPFAGLGTNDESLDVLIIHGMGQAMEGKDQTTSDYSRELRRKLAPQLGFAESPFEETPFAIEEGGVRVGTVLRARHKRPSGKSELAFYELSWAEAVKPMKIALLELDGAPRYREEKNPLERQRARLNSKAKSFLNTHLADPVIYAGKFGEVLRRDVEQAICVMTRLNPVAGARCDFAEKEKPPVKVAVISSSLGSAIAFDALSELESQGGARRTAARNVASATTHVFMFANQLPLMEMANVGAPDAANWLDQYPCPPKKLAPAAAAAPARGIGGFLGVRRAVSEMLRTQGLTPPPLYVVAFSDPNDLLTYFITKRFKDHCADATFANVAVTNAHWLWFSAFANPVPAHIGYRSNDEVLRMIVEGGMP